MKVQYKVKITMLGLLVSGILSSCAKNDFLPQTPIFGLGGESWPKTSTDDYIYQNFIVPYNIQVKYRWDPYEVNFAKTLTPVMPEKVIPVMEAIRKIWIEPYEKVTGNKGFIRKYAPKQFVLTGSAEYNKDGTIKLGQAEGGRKVLLLKLNDFDTKQISEVKLVMQTIHHEFGHILHQTVLYPSAFKSLNPQWYTSTWYNSSNEEANLQGLVTSYAKSNADDDFVETIAYLLIEGQAEFDALLARLETDKSINREASLKAANNLRQKEALIISYYRTSYGVDFKALQEEVRKAMDSLTGS